MTERRPSPWLRAAPLVALAAHVAVRVAWIEKGRFFACEDDPYRLYQAVLGARDAQALVGRFWLPGPTALAAALVAVGVPALWAGMMVSSAALVALGAALAGIARRAARAAAADAEVAAAAAWTIVLASPMTIALAHSALAELPAMALVALAAWAIVARAGGARRVVLVGAAAALAAATWCRYETWLIVPVAAAAAAWLARGHGRAQAIVAGAIVAAAGIGPIAWMLVQHARYGDALTFLHETDAVLGALAPAPARGRMLGARLSTLATWAPAVVALAAVAAARSPRDARRMAGWIAAAAAVLLVPALVDGREHPVWPARFAWPIEIGLVPLAALGVAALANARARAAAVAVAVVIALAPAATLRSAAMIDRDSVAAGLELRRGAHDRALAGGALLVERPVARPPMGWASVGVLWGRWDRTVWATPQRDGWELVEPSDPHLRATVDDAHLGVFLDQRGVRGAWTVSDATRAAVVAAWPGARIVRVGAGAFVFAR